MYVKLCQLSACCGLVTDRASGKIKRLVVSVWPFIRQFLKYFWTSWPVTLIFTSRCYASLVYAVVLCPSVCLSITSRFCIETTGPIELVLAWRLPSIYPTLCWKRKFSYLQKLGYFPLGLYPKLHRIFRQSKLIALSTKLVVVVDDDGRVCWRHLYDNRRVVAIDQL